MHQTMQIPEKMNCSSIFLLKLLYVYCKFDHGESKKCLLENFRYHTEDYKYGNINSLLLSHTANFIFLVTSGIMSTQQCTSQQLSLHTTNKSETNKSSAWLSPKSKKNKTKKPECNKSGVTSNVKLFKQSDYWAQCTSSNCAGKLHHHSSNFQQMLLHLLGHDHHQLSSAVDSPCGSDFDLTHTAEFQRKNLRPPSTEAVCLAELSLLLEL